MTEARLRLPMTLIATLCIVECGGDPSPPAPEGWFVIQVAELPSPQPAGTGDCPAAGARFEVQPGAGARATCRVQPDGDSFDVDATESNASGDSFSVTGKMSLSTSDIHLTVGHGSTTLASTGPCTVDFTGVSSGGVVAGQVEAVALCARADDSHGHTCYLGAEFAFTNCAQ